MNFIELVKYVVAPLSDARLVLALYQKIFKTTPPVVDPITKIDEQQEVGSVRKGVDRFLDVLSSPGVGTVLTVTSALLSLASPFGIAFGATLCAIALTSQVVTMARATSRMRTVRDTKEKDGQLDKILKLKNEEVKTTLNEEQKAALSNVVTQRIKEVLYGKGPIEKVDEKKWYNKISGMMRYTNLTSVKNFVLSILSFNVASVAISSMSMLISNGASLDGETSYRKEKDKLDEDVSQKQEVVLKTLGISVKYELSKGDIAKILAIKQTEQDIQKNIPLTSQFNTTTPNIEFNKGYATHFEKTNTASRSNNFIWDFGSLFSQSFSSEGYKKHFEPLKDHKELSQCQHNTDKTDTIPNVLGKWKHYVTHHSNSKNNSISPPTITHN
jgi:hypothetical protein